MTLRPDPKTWMCPNRKCRRRNVVPKRKCIACGTARRIRRAKHLAALSIPYETYVELNGGEFCALCPRPVADPKPLSRRLDRDHDHKTGRPRGLLCHKHNRLLQAWVTPELLRAAADYLERAAA